MTRDDLLKKCVDKGVADETTVGAVSHLFYVYLLSALQRGQRVEVPNFGTFGTKVVGVKRARKMPYFEVEPELASRVNERYRGLKYLVIGKYELISAAGDVEYTGKEVPADVQEDPYGKELIFDMNRDITLEEYERGQTTRIVAPPLKEKPLMPTLNLKDEGMEEKEPKPAPLRGGPLRPIPGLREPEPSGGGISPLVLVLIAVIIVAALAFALNYFGVIHLWGTKPPVVQVIPLQEPATQAEAMTEEPAQQPAETPQAQMTGATPTPASGGTQSGEQTPTPLPSASGSVPTTKATPEEPLTPVPGVSEKPLPAQKPMGTGNFTVQASSWVTDAKAQAEASKLTREGFQAYVQEAMVGGEAWYRVRVGRFATHQEAETEADKLRQIQEDGIWVTRVGPR